MSRYSNIRSVFRSSVFLVATLATPICFAADADRVQAQAHLLDHAEFLCSNCFFGASKHYYCFAADDKILIAYQKTPVLNYEDNSKNYLTPARPAWTPWSAPGEGAAVPISYDDKYIWIDRPEIKKAPHGFWGQVKGAAIWATHGEGKKVRLTRSSMGDIFINDDRCRSVGAAKSH
jgi:hypothetical protein